MKKIFVLLFLIVGLSRAMYSSAQNHEDDIAPPTPPCLPFVALGMPQEQWHARQCIEADIIISEFTPKLCELRRNIINKKGELEALKFNRNTAPDALSRLGRDLQILRGELHLTLTHADQRMRDATGIPLGIPTSRGCSMGFEQRPDQ
ncbi:MAG: hypothetical protein PHI96_04620 [Desulfovibrio sp.]|nr:hypothetical protein [Desulfovibrio sp.]